jgi:hypothetical protein
MLAFASCGGGGDDELEAGTDRSDVALSVVGRDRSGPAAEASLRCNGEKAEARGYGNADARTLCRAAIALAPFLARAPDPNRACTQVYGGPQTARIVGTIRGERIERRFSRTDGCRISDWDRALVLIPIRAE